MTFVCGPNFVWTSVFLPKLNNETNFEENPLRVLTTPREDLGIGELFYMGVSLSFLIIGPVANRYGKKTTLVIFMSCLVTANIMMAYGQDVLDFYWVWQLHVHFR